MYDRETKLAVPESFNFPFAPYDIQKQLMEEHFQTLEDKKIGIFESPTGTGKTLTLVCSALTWLVQHEKTLNEELRTRIETLKQEIAKVEAESNKQDDWISAQYETLQLKQKLSELKTELDNLTKYYKEIADLKHKTETDLMNKIEKFSTRDVIEEHPDEDDKFLIESDDEPEEEQIENKFNDVKIFFCSRTHSQLSQVVNEVKRTIFKAGTRVISLASRQNYCINSAVKALKSNTLINEKCLELQKNKEKSIKKGETKRQKVSEAKCQFYNQTNIERLRNESVGKIMDIEELGNLGKTRQACPYYSSRLTSVYAQLVLVPYQMILHKKTREQLGIDIRNSILIIDEAHNLLDTISNIYCAEISLTDLQTVKMHLEAYRQKYISRFSPNTVLRLKQLIFVAKSFALTLKNQEENKMLTVADFFYEAELFEIKLTELVKFAETSRLAQKVYGLAVSEEKKKKQIPEVPKPGVKDFLKTLEGKKEVEVQEVESENPKVHFPNVIRPFLAFLEAILNDSDDGRVLLSKSRMKYLILNPGEHFQEVISKCRSVTLAGGTMQPVDEVIEQLFHKHKDRVHVSCFGHVVPKESVVALAISKGPGGKDLLFNYGNRGDQSLMRDLASSISNICNVVPAGVVCFFPSYDFIDSFYKYITANGFLDKMRHKKVVYMENRKTQVDTLLEKYSKSIKYLKNNSNESQNGALLLSVVGGKLSEGLNFSDDLGRCVVVIGLPFPNKNDPELNERIKYLNEHLHATAGREYYENLCMKAVNQCIGRAVRHINDYASVVLLDTRFSMGHIRAKLPAWIERSLQVTESFGRAQQQLVAFFKAKQ